MSQRVERENLMGYLIKKIQDRFPHFRKAEDMKICIEEMYNELVDVFRYERKGSQPNLNDQTKEG